MALVIEGTVDLTEYAHNPEPKAVGQLSIIHEASGGELVQYYIDPENGTQGDKATRAVGVYDGDTRSYSYTEYGSAVWGPPGQRICGNLIDRLGVKAFPDVGAIAFYRLKHRNITRIVAPVNPKDRRRTAPALEAAVNGDGTVTFTVTPPEDPEYACYRIVMQCGIYTEEHITYETGVTVPPPRITGEYVCHATGYGQEGQLLSRDSNAVTLALTGASDAYRTPHCTRGETAALEERIRALEERIQKEGG